MTAISSRYRTFPDRAIKDPAPKFCPLCGLPVKLRHWSPEDGRVRYLYLACDGPGFLGGLLGLLHWPNFFAYGHWTFTLGEQGADVPIYDPDTGRSDG